MPRHFRLAILCLPSLLQMAVVSCSSVAVAQVGVTSSTAGRKILETAGFEGGLIVHLGCGDGRLTSALYVPGKSVVHGLDRDVANVERARRSLSSSGVYGPVSVEHFEGRRLPYAENLVNLLVAGDVGRVSVPELMRVVAPGGVVLVNEDNDWRRIVKTIPVGMDEWTHWLHDPSGNAVGHDQLMGPPRRFQWSAGPIWSRHHNTVPSLSAMVSSGGRVFAIVDEGPPAMAGTTPDKWFLIARDAFNGIELWRKPIADWGWRAWSTIWNERFNQPNNVAKRLVAVNDRVYVTLGFNAPLTALDAATGDVVQEYEGTEYTDEILYQGGLLIVSMNKGPQGPGELKDRPPVRKQVGVFDAESGLRRWTTGDFVGASTKTGPLERETHLLLAASNKQVVVLDDDEVISLDLRTGRHLWRSARPESPDYTSRYHHRMSDMCTLMATDEFVLLCQLEPIQKRIGWRVIKARLQAYAAKTGAPLWEYRCGNWGHFCVPDVFITNGLVWVHDSESMEIVGLNPATGVEERRLSTEKAMDNGHHHRCYRNKATDQYLLTSFRGVEFTDWVSGNVDRNHWVRGTCRYGIMPCNGMLYTTPHPCDCYVTSKLNGFFALAPAQRLDDVGLTATRGPTLLRGPSYDEPVPRPSDPGIEADAWPTYRHDTARTGGTKSRAPRTPHVLWKKQIPGGLITAPVVAEGKILTASVDGRTLYAMSIEDGEECWNYVADGRVDTPPTIWEGRVLFGCRSGWVYCLRLSDGTVMWRFHAAASQRLVMAHGSLESSWPVHGNVLVQNGEVSVTAGRSSLLDGGFMAYRLDARTGDVVDKRSITHAQDMTVDAGRNQNDDTGLLSDLLVSEGNSVFMRHLRIFGTDGSDVGWGARVGSTAGMLDDSWFNRTTWLVDGRDQGELMVCDAETVYSIRVHSSRGHGDYIVPGTGAYRLVATDRAPIGIPKPRKRDKLNSTIWPRPKRNRWTKPMAIRVTAMAVGGDTLLCAGTPDELDSQKPWSAYEGKRGGMLFTIAAQDGTQHAQIALDAAPTYDGLCIAGERAYVATVDGTLVCLGD